MLIFAYSSNPQDSVKAKFFLAEIFYHSTYGEKRIANPFENITEIK